MFFSCLWILNTHTVMFAYKINNKYLAMTHLSPKFNISIFTKTL